MNELGVFAMTEQGLREVSNPSAIFLSRGDEVTSGSSVMVLWEGRVRCSWKFRRWWITQ